MFEMCNGTPKKQHGVTQEHGVRASASAIPNPVLLSVGYA